MPRKPTATAAETTIRVTPTREPRQEPHTREPKYTRVPDITGRLDVAAARALERVVGSLPNPLIQGIYSDLKPVVDNVLAELLAPRTKRGTIKAIPVKRVPVHQNKEY